VPYTQAASGTEVLAKSRHDNWEWGGGGILDNKRGRGFCCSFVGWAEENLLGSIELSKSLACEDVLITLVVLVTSTMQAVAQHGDWPDELLSRDVGTLCTCGHLVLIFSDRMLGCDVVVPNKPKASFCLEGYVG
jgi:hypothetical protein